MYLDHHPTDPNTLINVHNFCISHFHLLYIGCPNFEVIEKPQRFSSPRRTKNISQHFLHNAVVFVRSGMLWNWNILYSAVDIDCTVEYIYTPCFIYSIYYWYIGTVLDVKGEGNIWKVLQIQSDWDRSQVEQNFILEKLSTPIGSYTRADLRRICKETWEWK